MKTILEYLVNSHVNHKYAKGCIVIPKVKNCFTDSSMDAAEASIIGEQSIPMTKEFIVYNDNYRGNRPHIAHLSDGLLTMLCYGDDAEDINPDRILFSADTLIECVRWVIEKYVKSAELDKIVDDCGDNINELSDKLDDLQIDVCDSTSFLADALYAETKGKTAMRNFEKEQTTQFDTKDISKIYDKLVKAIEDTFNII